MYYREITPRPELRTYIKCFWILEDPLNSASSVERIVPDGRMELIFHYGSPFERVNDESASVQAPGIVTGQIRKPLLIRPTGPIGMLAVRFFPFGFSSLFTIPSNELAHSLHSIDGVLGKRGLELQERVLGASTNNQRIQILENFFLELLAERGDYEFRIHRVTRKIYELRGVFRIEDLAQEFNISARQIERLFQQKVGLSPNVFGRLIRFQSAVAMKVNDLTLSLTDLSHEAGYYDQSHFIKDFRDFSGLSPRQYFLEVHHMADLFTDGL